MVVLLNLAFFFFFPFFLKKKQSSLKSILIPWSLRVKLGEVPGSDASQTCLPLSLQVLLAAIGLKIDSSKSRKPIQKLEDLKKLLLNKY